MTVKQQDRDLSDEELLVLQRGACAVWDELGYEFLAALAEDKGQDINRITISRAEVIELVCDANRLEDNLKRHGHTALAAKVSDWDLARFTQALKPAFQFSRYGL